MECNLDGSTGVGFNWIASTYSALYSVALSLLIDGGASSGALPQCVFGLSTISRVRTPPFAISDCRNHARLRGLPFN